MPAAARAAVGDRGPRPRALPRVPDRGRSRARAQPRVEHAAGRPGKPITHVVAFGGSRPIMAGPVLRRLARRAADHADPRQRLRRRRVLHPPPADPRRRAGAQRVGDRQLALDKVEQDRRAAPATRTSAGSPTGSTAPTGTLAPSRPRARAAPGERSAATACALGLFGQLKAKKGGVFLLDALLRSGVADRFHLLLAGWMAPDMEAWLAEHELDAHRAAVPGPLRAAAVVRGVRLASRSRPSTTGCRTCWWRPPRSACR